MNSKTSAKQNQKSDSKEMLTHFIDEWSDRVFADETATSLMDNEFKAALSKAFNGMSPIEI